jgi:phosphoesterase RecJ-like protein
MVSYSNFKKAVELIDKSSSILITTHIQPDGDACGSLVALRDTLSALGKKTELVLPSELPEWHKFLFAEKPAILGKDVTIEQLKQGQFFEPDLIVLIDVNSNNQLSKLSEYLKQNDKPVLVIDHHVTNDGLGDVELTDTDAAATGIIVFDLLRYANWPVTDKIAQALFVAIATDTGWFRFPNTDNRAYQACADLTKAGANSPELYRRIYQNSSCQRLKLTAAMLNTLELHFDERFATQYLLQQDFEQTGAELMDTENLVNECQRIGTVEAAALLVELKNGRVKCSLRSKGAIDVRKIATKLGGGGHDMAAGVHLHGPIEKAKELVLVEMAEQFKQLDAN